MSWPVSGTLMIEPTESESQARCSPGGGCHVDCAEVSDELGGRLSSGWVSCRWRMPCCAGVLQTSERAGVGGEKSGCQERKHRETRGREAMWADVGASVRHGSIKN